ncbi:MAG TPA: MFS transporter [Candidatus Limnocylindrales bacterium]|nr:MFS transporter [Candidatus Limnocylindrales bacterium]
MNDLRRNVAIDLVVAVGIAVTSAIVNALLPTIARQTGMAPIGIAVLAAAPYVGNLLGAFAGRIGPQTRPHLALTRALGAGFLLSLAFAPDPLLIVIVVLFFWLSLSLSNPFHFGLWSSMYEARQRARVIGVIGTCRAAAAGGAAVGLGLLADRFGPPVAMGVAGAIGVVCTSAALWFRGGQAAQHARYSAREAIRSLTGRPSLRTLVLAQGFYGGGMIAAAPLYALVYVDRLGLSLADVGSIAIVSAAATTATYYAWGALVDRRGGRAALKAGASLGLCSVLIVAVSPSLPVLWLAAAAGGLASAAIDLGIQGAIADETPPTERAAAMAGWNAITGARGSLVPFASTALVQAGLLSVTAALLVCAVPVAIGTAIYIGRQPRARGARGVVAVTELGARHVGVRYRSLVRRGQGVGGSV